MSLLEDLTRGGVEGFGSAVAKAVGAFKADPTKVIELEAEIIKAAQNFESQVVASVNATMQAEAKSEHWAQWAWRPLVGFTFCATIINNYVLYAYLAKIGVVQIVIPETVWAAFLAILGVAAYVRGRDKGNGNGGH